MIRAAAVAQFVWRVELFAADAVEPLVMLAVQIARLGASPPEPLHPRPVPGITARVDHIVNRQPERLAQRHERRSVPVNEFLDRNARRLGGQHVRQRIVVGAGLEADLVTTLTVVARQHVGLDQLQRMAKVRPAVDVGNGGGEVGTGTAHRNLR